MENGTGLESDRRLILSIKLKMVVRIEMFSSFNGHGTGVQEMKAPVVKTTSGGGVIHHVKSRLTSDRLSSRQDLWRRRCQVTCSAL